MLFNKVLCITACMGFMLSIIVHVVSALGFYVGDHYPFVWLLHLGVFVVWFPTIISLISNPKYKRKDRKYGDSFKTLYTVVFKDMPKSLMFFSLFCFVYAILNFMFFVNTGLGRGPSISDGKYVLHNHGTLIKEISENEYLRFKAMEIRGFSVLWMVFYSGSIGVLWPKSTVVTESLFE